MGNSAPKRTEMQIVHDRKRITELLLQGYSHQKIADTLFEETGIRISRSGITKEVARIRDTWMEKANINYAQLLNQELARIDMTEAEVWKAWFNSCSGIQKEIVEKVAAELDKTNVEDDLAIAKVIKSVEKMGGAGEPRFLTSIIDLQKERRRILGLYAPARLGIDIREKKELVIKGYAVREISPDAWPEIVEGEIVDAQNVLPERTDDGQQHV